MQCTRLNWDDWISDRSFLPHLHQHPELTELVRSDKMGQIGYLRRAPKRRAGPSWGVLAEALGMCIGYRMYRFSRRRTYTPETFSRRFNDLLALIRIVGFAPLSVLRSQSFAQAKNNGKLGIKGQRVLHCFDAF